MDTVQSEVKIDKPTSLAQGALIGAITSLPLMGLAYLGLNATQLPSPPFVLFDWLARILPGPIVTFGIDLLVNFIGWLNIGPTSAVVKPAEQALASILFMLVGAAFGITLAWISRKDPQRTILGGRWIGVALAVIFLGFLAWLGFPGEGPVASAIWLGAIFLLWGQALGWMIRVAGPAIERAPESPISRRDFLYVLGGGTVILTVGSVGLARWVSRDTEVEEVLAGLDVGGTGQPTPEAFLADRIEPAPGTRLEQPSTKDFYRIDINTFPPQVDGSDWRLEIDGQVRNPMSLTIEDLRARPAISQYITLSCISNHIGGDLIGTSLWTGVQLSALLDEAGLRDTVVEIAIEATDGFYESIKLADAMDDRTMLVYEMNGEPLSEDHGFPLRIYIPDRYGMKQPKWIKRMEAIDHEGKGYWVDRGWSPTAYVNTTSVIDTDDPSPSETTPELMPLGGIAYAGAKGISKVEVQVDESPWEKAQLRIPPLGPLTWVQWRYDWPFQSGRHTIRVRAYDGQGVLQETSTRGIRPDGATGVHSVSFTV